MPSCDCDCYMEKDYLRMSRNLEKEAEALEKENSELKKQVEKLRKAKEILAKDLKNRCDPKVSKMIEDMIDKALKTN